MITTEQLLSAGFKIVDPEDPTCDEYLLIVGDNALTYHNEMFWIGNIADGIEPYDTPLEYFEIEQVKEYIEKEMKL